MNGNNNLSAMYSFNSHKNKWSANSCRIWSTLATHTERVWKSVEWTDGVWWMECIDAFLSLPVSIAIAFKWWCYQWCLLSTVRSADRIVSDCMKAANVYNNDIFWRRTPFCLFVEFVCGDCYIALLARLFVDFAKSLSAWKGIARGAASP